MEVLQKTDEALWNAIGAQDLPQGLSVDAVVSLGKVNEGQV